ncbi:hypothetical protein [Actinoplanes sp. NPDC049118]|uniref:hypothetical protein n=1 Tax=Actinoplanes sp. NPDC049118 TaxID=3155769 RepID=UPI0033D6C30C
MLDETMGLGADSGSECVGYQAHEPDGEERASLTMNRLVASVRFTGRIGTVGVFVPQDPGAGDELAKQGKLAFDFGMFWFKGQHIGSGQAPVKKYNRQLRDLIAAGKAEPSFIVSHELPSTVRRRPTSTSTSGMTAGRRSSCTQRLRERVPDMAGVLNRRRTIAILDRNLYIAKRGGRDRVLA